MTQPPGTRLRRRAAVESLLHGVRGFAMGAADVVPGVSGGTIALVLGIYERLVEAVHRGSRALGRLVVGDVRGGVAALRTVEWRFVLPLAGGIGVAVLSLARLIETLLEERPVEMAALFFGLVAASSLVAWRMLLRPETRHVPVALATAVVVAVVLGFRSGPVTDPAAWLFPAAGAIAICAMILPGISGSFLLLEIGMYEAVIGALNDRDLLLIGLFAAGAVVGLASFSTLLARLLADHHDTVLAVLVGLMVGSLRVLWPWPEGTAGTEVGAPSGSWWIPVLLAVGAAAVVAGVARAGARRPVPPPGEE